MWFSYRFFSAPSEGGVGLKFASAPSCDEPRAFFRPGFSLQINDTKSGSYNVVHKLRARDHFLNRQLSALTLSGKMNPFSEMKDLRAVFEDGEVSVEWADDADDGAEAPPLSARPIQVRLSAYIDPDKYLSRECAEASEVDGTHVVVDCECVNARGLKKKCHLELSDGVSNALTIGQECCDQLNKSESSLQLVEASFEAKYCHNLCSSTDPKLLQRWCPPQDDA